MKKQPEMTAATKQRLVDAFWTLYEKKRIDQIRVKEITDLAQLHRGTFYEYFNDIYDLAAQEETEIMQQLEETMAVKQQNKESNNDLRNIAEFYLKNGRRLNLLIASGCVWQVGIQPARQRKSNHFGSEIQPPYCSAIALSNVANGNSAHHA